MNKRTTTILWIVAGVIVLAAGIFAYIYNYTDVFKQSASTLTTEAKVFTTNDATGKNFICRYDAALTQKDCTFPTGLTSGGNSLYAIGKDLYVMNNTANGWIARIDIPTWTLVNKIDGTATAKIGGNQITADGNYIYVVNKADKWIHSWSRDLTPVHVANPEGETLAAPVTADGSNKVSVVAGGNNIVSDGTYLYSSYGPILTASRGGDWIKKIDISSWKVVAVTIKDTKGGDPAFLDMTGTGIPNTKDMSLAGPGIAVDGNFVYLLADKTSQYCTWNKNLTPVACYKANGAASTTTFGTTTEPGSTTGTSTTTTPSTTLKFAKPSTVDTAISADQNGNLYAVNPNTNYVRKISVTSNAEIAEFITGTGASLNNAQGVAYLMPDAQPTVTFAVNGNTNAVTVNSGDTITATWSATAPTGNSGTIACTASGTPKFSGVKTALNTAGEVITDLTATTTLGLSCTLNGGTAVDSSVVVTVTAPTPVTPALIPTVDLKGNSKDGPFSIASGGSVLLTWTSTNLSYASSCTASGSPSFTGVQTDSNSTGVLVSGITTSTTFNLSCSEGSQVATDSVVVTIAATASTGTRTTGTTAGATTTTTADTGPNLPIVALLSVVGSGLIIYLINRAIKLIRS